MENRNKKIEDKGCINFESSMETSVNEKKYAVDFINPPIPKRYKYICGEWNNGFVIEREYDGSQFVWIPVGCLNSDGTLDGENFTEKFGRRNYRSEIFSKSEFHEELTDELAQQFESVKKYGGFYISRYNISKSSEGKPQSVKGEMPWVNINFHDAKKVAASIEDNETVKSHLTYGAEYDSVLAWFIKSKAKTLKQITGDLVEGGGVWIINNSPRKILRTGSREDRCINNIYDFGGNVDEWTQEKNEKPYRVVRGGFCRSDGKNFPDTFRFYLAPFSNYFDTGFRAILDIK